MKIAIAIPVYKSHLSDDEQASVRQCCRILGRYDIFIVCPENLDIAECYRIAGDCPIREKRFASHYFASITGYNELMTDAAFYKSFKAYDYLLIYQPDAWVFRDELEDWCAKGYDYIGAPWLDNFGYAEEGNRLWKVGNGGFSLRKVKSFIRRTKSHLRIQGFKDVFSKEYHGLKTLRHCIVKSLGGRGNRMKDVREKVNEDTIFSVCMTSTPLKIPSVEVALGFAFERSPSYLYKLNGNRLPFGCHAWRRYEYEEFWSRYIQL